MIQLVISGGQTGADQAGWRAAKSAGIATGGWMPHGFKTEDGPRPEFAEIYGAKEHGSTNYAERTEANVRDSQATLWLGTTTSRGYKATHKATRFYKTSRPIMVAYDGRFHSGPTEVIDWFRWHSVTVLNIAGNRESSAPGIGAWVEAYLTEVFRILKEE